MELKEWKLRKALNKAFLNVKPNTTAIKGFKTYQMQLRDRINDTESDKFDKNLIIDFFFKKNLLRSKPCYQYQI
jgi:hypothetical protein